MKTYKIELTTKEVLCVERAFDYYALKAKDAKKDKKTTSELLKFFRGLGGLAHKEK